MERQIGVMKPHTEEYGRPPNAGRNKEQIFPRACRWDEDLPTPQLRPSETVGTVPGFPNIREQMFVVLSYQVCSNLLQQPEKTNRVLNFNLNLFLKQTFPFVLKNKNKWYER